MELLTLPLAALEALWPTLAPFAQQMTDAFPDDWPVAEIRRQAASGLLQLWAVVEPAERGLYGLVGTEIHRKPSGRKTLSVALAAGRDHQRWVDRIATLEDHAAAQGCDAIEVRGRAGWTRHLPDYRARRGVILTKELTPMGKQNSQIVPPTNTPPMPSPVLPNQASIQEEAARLYNEGFGWTPYPGSTYVGMSDTSRDALAALEAIARAPNPLLGQATAATQQLVNWGGISPELRASLAPIEALAAGNRSVGSQDLYSQIYAQAGQPSAASGYLSGIASGAQGIGTPGLFGDIYASAAGPTAAEQYLAATARGDFLSQPNPYLQQVIDDRSQQIANQVKDAYSGMGRYGSSALNRDLTDRLAQFQAGVLSQNHEAERQRQMEAAQQIDAGNWQRLAAQYQAALGQTNAEAANIENRIGAARAIDTSLADRWGAQLSAAGGYTNAQATDISNMFGAAGTLADVYSAGLNRMLSAANAVPGLAEARYAPALHLAQVGAARESDQAAQLADLLARYNYQQRAPMDALSWLNAITTGAGYSPTVPPQSVTQSPWFQALG